jgi:hypothetical protein
LATPEGCVDQDWEHFLELGGGQACRPAPDIIQCHSGRDIPHWRVVEVGSGSGEEDIGAEQFRALRDSVE